MLTNHAGHVSTEATAVAVFPMSFLARLFPAYPECCSRTYAYGNVSVTPGLQLIVNHHKAKVMNLVPMIYLALPRSLPPESHRSNPVANNMTPPTE